MTPQQQPHSPGRLKVVDGTKLITDWQNDFGDEVVAKAVKVMRHNYIANARRLAACWNALQRVSTKGIELIDPDELAAAVVIKVAASAPPTGAVSLGTLPKVHPPGLQSVWTDSATITVRDGNMATVQFYYFMPDAAIEVFRMQTSVKRLREFADLIVKVTALPPSAQGEEPADGSKA